VLLERFAVFGCEGIGERRAKGFGCEGAHFWGVDARGREFGCEEVRVSWCARKLSSEDDEVMGPSFPRTCVLAQLTGLRDRSLDASLA
jgi:hypothetical protein